MSVYRRQGKNGRDKDYSYDFQLAGHRFCGRTGETEKRRAEAAEQRIRAEAKAAIAARPAGRLTFGEASTRWYLEAGQYHKNVVDTRRALAWLQREIGLTTPIDAIGNGLVAELVAKRRSGADSGLPLTNKKPVAPATVNRQVIEPLRGILRRAATLWEQPTRSIDWKAHALAEPQERIREMTTDEEAAFFAAVRPDYAPIFLFALLTGCRMAECLDLEWRAIDWRAKRITITGKGDRVRLVPLSDAVAAILRPLPRADARVFCYQVKRADHGPRGSLRPIEREGLKITFARTCKKAGVTDFRFHDFRHTAATRLLRASGNLRLVQRLLGHADIATTTKYAHATADDLLAAMNQAAAPAAAPAESPAQSPARAARAGDK